MQLQIKDSLRKISEQYYKYQKENKSSLFNYYCTPFLNNSYNKNDNYYINRCKENNEINKTYGICPFEQCKDE